MKIGYLFTHVPHLREASKLPVLRDKDFDKHKTKLNFSTVLFWFNDFNQHVRQKKYLHLLEKSKICF